MYHVIMVYKNLFEIENFCSKTCSKFRTKIFNFEQNINGLIFIISSLNKFTNKLIKN